MSIDMNIENNTQTEMQMITTNESNKENNDQEFLLKIASPQTATQRDISFDMFRGIIMITMALDHIRDVMATGASHAYWFGQIPNTYYTKFDGDLGKGSYYFFLRFLAQICTPGFMVLMGFGMVHFYEHRHGKIQWSHKYTTSHLMLRGIVIIICGFFVYYATCTARQDFKFGTDHNIWWSWDILVPLGFNMFFISIFVHIENLTFHNQIKLFSNAYFGHLGMAIILFIILFCVISTELIVPHYTEYCSKQQAANGECEEYAGRSAFVQFVWLPQSTATYSFYCTYPLIPWMSAVCVGIIMGRYTWCAMKDKFMDRCMRHYLILGVIMFFLFIVLRALDGFGNFGEPWRGPNASSPWYGINFFVGAKYPPSVQAILIQY